MPKTVHRTKTSREERQDELDTLLKACRQDQELDSWNSFVEAMAVPMDVYPAMMTGRAELLDLMTPRVLTEDECAKMFHVLKTLIRTNQALQTHAQKVSLLVRNWENAFKALRSTGDDIVAFASFTSRQDEEDR